MEEFDEDEANPEESGIEDYGEDGFEVDPLGAAVTGVDVAIEKGAELQRSWRQISIDPWTSTHTQTKRGNFARA
jgi:hypothetical protein